MESESLHVLTEFSSLSLQRATRLLYSLVVQRYLIYIFIIFVDNDESWQSYNRRLFARVPTILTPNYLIRVRVRDRLGEFFLHNGKGGKREEEKLSRMVVALG